MGVQDHLSAWLKDNLGESRLGRAGGHGDVTIEL
jgi:hypothetical protein